MANTQMTDRPTKKSWNAKISERKIFWLVFRLVIVNILRLVKTRVKDPDKFF